MHRQKEILDIRPNRVRQVFRQVFVFARKQFIKSIRMVDIEWRDKPWFGLRTFLLQPLRIGIKHRPAQWADAY